MPEVDIVAGERRYTVGCKQDELEAVSAAAEVLNNQLAEVAQADRTMPPSQMFMLAGLQLADNLARESSRQADMPDQDILAGQMKRIIQLADGIENKIQVMAGASDKEDAG